VEAVVAVALRARQRTVVLGLRVTNFSVVRPVRAAAANTRAKGPHHDDARSFDGSGYNWADGVSDALSDPVSLAHGVPNSLTEAVEEARYKGCSSARRARLSAFVGSQGP
jgi:hypothetical protein